MLARNRRLTQDQEFKKINNSGRSFFSPSFTLKYLINRRDFSRFGIVISTKVSKKATVRNRLKRQLREILRLNEPKIRSGYDIVVIIKNQAIGKSYQVLAGQILDALAKSRLLK